MRLITAPLLVLRPDEYSAELQLLFDPNAKHVIDGKLGSKINPSLWFFKLTVQMFVQIMARGHAQFLCHPGLENPMSQIWMKNITERN